MGLDVKTLAAAKKYTKETVAGAGAIVGKNVIIKSQGKIDGGNRITFSYTTDDGIEKETSIDVMNGKDGVDGISPAVQINNGADGSVTLTVTDASGTNTTPNLKGEQGKRGDDGYPFLIYKEYADVSDFDEADFPEIGLMFMVKDENEPEGYPVYRYTGNDNAQHYSLVTHLGKTEAIKGDKGEPGQQGAQGVPGRDGVDGKDGITYKPTIGTVTKGDNPSANVTTDDTQKTATFDFVLPKGDKGDKGEPGADGQDGTNGTDGTDGQPGKDGKDGRSITKIEMDDSNNVFATFSDGNKENIGKLDVNVEADFLTEGGFGKLRYYDGKFQRYDDSANDWVDASVSPQNPYILQMIPQEMQFITGIYDTKAKHYKLKWIEPNDTIIEGQNAVIVEKVVIRRKQNSAPTGVEDGTEVVTVMRSQFGDYANAWFTDETFSPSSGEVWVYKAFPVSTSGFVNTSEVNQTLGIKAKNYTLFGFRIDQTESDPPHLISYLENCDNANFRPAHMDYDAERFDYGDWTIDGGAWFMNVKPCLLKRDGTVEKFLNPDDLTHDLEGNDVTSEIQGDNNTYNVMNQNPCTYWLIHKVDDNTADVYFSDMRLHYDDANGEFTEADAWDTSTGVKDGDFVLWSNIDENGNEIPYFYTPAFNGSNVSNVLRTLSGKTPINTQTTQTEITYATANNDNGSHIWYTEVYCDRVLIDLLLLLIGKSTDTQTVFGQGYHTGGSSASNLVKTGGMNQKGLFYGTKANSSTGVKVFGMEHYWGNQWRRIAGWMLNKTTQKVKMTYGQSDGSQADGYNTTGADYIEIPDSAPTGTSSGGYIKKCLFTEHGIIPKDATGTQTTYFTDGLWFKTAQDNYAIVGGTSVYGLRVGALCAGLDTVASSTDWSIGAAVSCKPLKATQEEDMKTWS